MVEQETIDDVTGAAAADAETEPATEAPEETTPDEPTDDHLADVSDGCGCTEVWEHLSDQRED